MDILTMLKGGDRRSIGRADELVALVLEEPALFHQVVRGMTADDLLVRMRAADIVEKVTIEHTEYLKPYKEYLLYKVAVIDQQEVRWHMAQIFPRLDLTADERKFAIDILLGYLDDNSSIVKVFSMEALAVFAERDDSNRPWITELLVELTMSGTPAMRSRGKQLLERLKTTPGETKTDAQKQQVIRELTRIRNIGPAIAEKLYVAGFRSSREILQGDPEAIFERLQDKLGHDLDRCVLYVLRGAKADKPWPQYSDKNIGIKPGGKSMR